GTLGEKYRRALAKVRSRAGVTGLSWNCPCPTSIAAVEWKKHPVRSIEPQESAKRGQTQAHRSRYLPPQATSKRTIPRESARRKSNSQADLPSPTGSGEEIIAPATRMRFPEKPRRTEMDLMDQNRCTSFQAFSAARRDTKLPRSIRAARFWRADARPPIRSSAFHRIV